MAEQNREVNVRVNIKTGDQSAAKSLDETAKKADEATKAVEGLNEALKTTPTDVSIKVTADGVKDAVAGVQGAANDALKATGQTLRDMLRAVVQETGKFPDLSNTSSTIKLASSFQEPGNKNIDKAMRDVQEARLGRMVFDHAVSQGKSPTVETFDQSMALATLGQAGVLREFSSTFPGMTPPSLDSKEKAVSPPPAPEPAPSPGMAALAPWIGHDPNSPEGKAMQAAIAERLQAAPIEPAPAPDPVPVKVEATSEPPKPAEPAPKSEWSWLEPAPALIAKPNQPWVSDMAPLPSMKPLAMAQQPLAMKPLGQNEWVDRSPQSQNAPLMPIALPAPSIVAQPSANVREHMDFYRPFRGDFEASKANKEKVEVKPEPLNDLGRRISDLREATAADARHTDAKVGQEDVSWVRGRGKSDEGSGQMSETDKFSTRLMRVQWQAQAGQMAIQGLVGAASPDALRTFTGSLELLAGEIGQAFIPGTIRMSGWLQQAARGWRDMDRGTKENITTLATWTTVGVGGAWAVAKVGSSLAQAGAAWVSFGGAAARGLAWTGLLSPAGAAITGLAAGVYILAQNLETAAGNAERLTLRTRAFQATQGRMEAGATVGQTEIQQMREVNPELLRRYEEAAGNPAQQREILLAERARLQRTIDPNEDRIAREVERILSGLEGTMSWWADRGANRGRALQSIPGMNQERLLRMGVNPEDFAWGIVPGFGGDRLGGERIQEIVEAFRNPTQSAQTQISVIDSMLRNPAPSHLLRTGGAGIADRTNAEAAPLLRGLHQEVSGLTEAQRADRGTWTQTMSRFSERIAANRGMSVEAQNAAWNQGLRLFTNQGLNTLRVPTAAQIQATNPRFEPNRNEPIISRQPVFQQSIEAEGLYAHFLQGIGRDPLQAEILRTQQEGNRIAAENRNFAERAANSLNWIESRYNDP